MRCMTVVRRVGTAGFSIPVAGQRFLHVSHTGNRVFQADFPRKKVANCSATCSACVAPLACTMIMSVLRHKFTCLLLLLPCAATTVMGQRAPSHTSDAEIALCPALQLQNEVVTAAFSSCTGELNELSRRDGRNVLAGATTAADRGPFAIWVDAPPPWVAANALNQGKDTLDHGTRSCSGGSCVTLPRNGSAPLTPSGCRLVSHSLNSSSSKIPLLTMVLVPKDASLRLRITLGATFADSGPDPRLVLTLSVENTGSAPLHLQTALPYLRGVRLGTGNASDLGLFHLETGCPGQSAWSGCTGGATSDSCGGKH
jgi:hypothetical protein